MNLLKKTLLSIIFVTMMDCAFAQTPHFTIIKNNPATSVKNQGSSGTCWCFSSTAMMESELLLKKQPETDLSETFTVYNLYLDKAEKYIRRRGNARFTEGGLGQDFLYAEDRFGAMPQSVYPGIGRDTIMRRNYQMAAKLKAYLDKVLKDNPDTIPTNWKEKFTLILNSYLGVPPKTFTFNGKTYTPQAYAREVIPYKPTDFIGLTSFTHHPFYSEFVMEVPDNYNDNAYYNVPLNELIETVKTCIKNGYTLTWDADVSNPGFQALKGVAMWVNNEAERKSLPAFTERQYSADIRQQLFDKQETQDDHLMQITGLATDGKGNQYFIVKNSWGVSGPFKGYVYVSMPYFAINTISVLVDKKAMPTSIIAKLAR